MNLFTKLTAITALFAALCAPQCQAAENDGEVLLYLGGGVVITTLGFTTAAMLGYDTPINLPGFLAQNEEQILLDAAQGGGEHLSGVFDLLSLLPEEQAEAEALVQERFDDWADDPVQQLPELLEAAFPASAQDG